jgi:hypothetical protein
MQANLWRCGNFVVSSWGLFYMIYRIDPIQKLYINLITCRDPLKEDHHYSEEDSCLFFGGTNIGESL